MQRSSTGLLAVATVVGALGLTACGDTGAPADAAGCATVTVDVGDFTFDTDPVEVRACDSVVWRNGHDQAHTSTGDGDRRWSTGNLAPGDTSEPLRFDEVGAFSYVSALHPFMQGTVQVT